MSNVIDFDLYQRFKIILFIEPEDYAFLSTNKNSNLKIEEKTFAEDFADPLFPQ